MIVTVFRSRLQPEHAAEYSEVATQMRALAEGMPGFVSFKTFRAEDGERVSIIEFESEETLRAWREHPEAPEGPGAGASGVLRGVPDPGVFRHPAVRIQAVERLSSRNSSSRGPYESREARSARPFQA